MTINTMQPTATCGPAGAVTAEVLNSSCYCQTLDAELLRKRLEVDPALSGLLSQLQSSRPHLFSSTVVFLSEAVATEMAAVVAAIERCVALPAYRELALSRAPAITQHDFGPQGAFNSCDFHVGSGGPRLIEINTNAGGALLNAALARAQHDCCEAMHWVFKSRLEPASLDQQFIDMFLGEWRRQRVNASPRRVLIVDDAPHDQYLAPEFELFDQLFRRNGISSAIADAAALEWRAGRLWHQGEVVDMVYNRLTDFYLAAPPHAALAAAYAAGAVVLTPHPRAHALRADKRNLVVLSDDECLAAWGVADDDRRLLAAVVPRTRLVTAGNADALWAERRRLFFKPVAGFGGKAAYRGDKLTRRAWADILAGQFVAQEIAPPGERLTEVNGKPTDLRFDVRAYAYGNEVQLLAARMYAGQTTNFRTPGGGFAPVIVVAAS